MSIPQENNHYERRVSMSPFAGLLNLPIAIMHLSDWLIQRLSNKQQTPDHLGMRSNSAKHVGGGH